MSSDETIIIGGGLGGLCLAQGLRRAGLPFRIFEREDAIDACRQGYSLRIDAAGQDALARCLPVDLLYLLYQTASLADSEPRFVDSRAAPLSTIVLESRANGTGGLPDLCVNRHTMLEILRCGLEGQMHHGHALDRFEERDDAVVARFANGEEVTGGLLVGADGAGSVVRRRMAPDVEPQDTGMVCIHGRTAATAALCSAIGRDLCAGTTSVSADGITAIIDVMTFHGSLPAVASDIAPDCVLSPVDDHFSWALTGPAESLAYHDTDRLADIVWQRVRGWAPALQAIILRGDPADWTMRPVRSLQPDRPLCTSHLALLGDAAHVMGSTGGSGAGTALQDAAELAAQIIRARKANEAIDLGAYDIAMRQRAIEAVRASSRTGERRAVMMAA